MGRRRKAVVAVVSAVVALAVAVVVVRTTGSDGEPPTREQRLRALDGVADVERRDSDVVVTIETGAISSGPEDVVSAVQRLVEADDEVVLAPAGDRGRDVAGVGPRVQVALTRESPTDSTGRMLRALTRLPSYLRTAKARIVDDSFVVDASTSSELSSVTQGVTAALARERIVDETSHVTVTLAGDDPSRRRFELLCDEGIAPLVPAVDRLATGISSARARLTDASSTCDVVRSVGLEIDDGRRAPSIRRAVDRAVGYDVVGELVADGTEVSGNGDLRRAFGLAEQAMRAGATVRRVTTDLDSLQLDVPDLGVYEDVLDLLDDASLPADARIEVGSFDSMTGSSDAAVNVEASLRGARRTLGWVRRMDRAGYRGAVVEGRPDNDLDWGLRVDVADARAPTDRPRPERAVDRRRLVSLLRGADLPGRVAYSLPAFGEEQGWLVFRADDRGRARPVDGYSSPSADGRALVEEWNRRAG